MSGGGMSRGNSRIPLHVPAGSWSSQRRGRCSVHYDDFAAGAVAGDKAKRSGPANRHDPTIENRHVMSVPLCPAYLSSHCRLSLE